MSNQLAELLPKNAQQFSHAYLLVTADIGTTIRELSSTVAGLLCSQTENVVSCGQCQSCNLLSANTHPDLFTLSDEITVGVDEVRSLAEFVYKKPQISQSKIVVIKEQAKLTENANNALLKTLEEPSENTYLFLLTTSLSSVLPTIVSRCHVVNVPFEPKEALIQKYPDIPEYVIAYANGATSKLEQWQESGLTDAFSEVYHSFVLWLKREISPVTLASKVKQKDEFLPFLMFLIQKRIRQRMIKQPESLTNHSALELLNKTQSQLYYIAGINKELTVNRFLNELTGQI